MSERVIDSSFILAVLKQERIDLVNPDVIDGAVMSAVNVEETYGKAFEVGLRANSVDAVLARLKRVEAFTLSQARIGAAIRERTHKLGIGLGDRACLALGIELMPDVYTAEHSWSRVELGCQIILIRRDRRS